MTINTIQIEALKLEYLFLGFVQQFHRKTYDDITKQPLSSLSFDDKRLEAPFQHFRSFVGLPPLSREDFGKEWQAELIEMFPQLSSLNQGMNEKIVEDIVRDSINMS